MEGVGIVVHAVQADDDRPGLTRRVPMLQAKARPVEGDEGVLLKPRPGEGLVRPADLLHQRRAGGQGEHGEGGDQGADHAVSISAVRARR